MTFPIDGFNYGSEEGNQPQYQSNPHQQQPVIQQSFHPGTDFSQSMVYAQQDGNRKEFLEPGLYARESYPVGHQVVPPPPSHNFIQHPGDYQGQANSYESLHLHNAAMTLPRHTHNPSVQQGWIPAKQDFMMPVSSAVYGGRNPLEERGYGGRNPLEESVYEGRNPLEEREYGGRNPLVERDSSTTIPVRSSLLYMNNHDEKLPRTRMKSVSSGGCTSSTSSDSFKEARHPRLTNAEIGEFAALIQDLWRGQRFAQEFKKYSVSEYTRIRAILKKIESDKSRRRL